MRIPGAKTLRTFSRWVQARLLGGALILGYHRIASAGGAYPEMCVSPENFAEHLQVLRKYTRPIRLSRLVQHLRDGSLPKKSIAITFDDGYADNCYEAKPLLENYEMPATVFICTGYTGKEFWWDELERLVACSRRDLPSLPWQSGGKQFQWDPTKPNVEAGHAEFRDEFRRKLYCCLLSLDPYEQHRVMDILRGWSNAPSMASSSPRAMNREEILQLVDGGLVEVGAHTSHHPMLPQLSRERQREEIESSKSDLEKLLGKPVSGFAYPNGRATEHTKWLLRELGFVFACTSLHDVVRPGSDMYHLSRFWQQDLDGDGFARGLKRWLSM